MIADVCSSCAQGSLTFRDNGSGSSNVEWVAVDCPLASSFQGLEYMGQGSNEWYIKVQPRNFRLPVESMAIVNYPSSGNRITLDRSSDGFFTKSPGIQMQGTLTVEVVSVDGQTITDRIDMSSVISSTPFRGKNNVQFGATADQTYAAASMSASGIPDYSKDFAPVSSAYQVSSNDLQVVSNDYFAVQWTTAAVDKYTTVEGLRLKANSGVIGLGFRYGQSGAGRENDRVEWRFWMDGSNAKVQWCRVRQGTDYCTDKGTRSFPSADGLDITLSQSFDDSTARITSVVQWTTSSGKQSLSGNVPESQFPVLGRMGFAFYQTSGAVISDLRLATTSTFTVSLSECLDDATWTDLFYSLVPEADPATTSVTFIGEPTECGGAKALVSGLTFAVTSVGSSAPAIANSFTTVSGSAAGAAAGINSASVVGGTAGATAAGIPAAGAAGGGGGGAAGGLSGGAIAGIVIGSVAGGVLLLGVTALIVGAVVVGAVVLAKSGNDDSRSSNVESGAGQRRSISQRVRSIFGGVDVMNSPGKGHQSITARSPPVR